MEIDLEKIKEKSEKMYWLLQEIYAWAEENQNIIGIPPFLSEIDELNEEIYK